MELCLRLPLSLWWDILTIDISLVEGDLFGICVLWILTFVRMTARLFVEGEEGGVEGWCEVGGGFGEVEFSAVKDLGF